MTKGCLVRSVKKEEGRMREIKRGPRWELSYLSVEELTEASPGERQMNDVFLSQKYVDKRSPAHPVSDLAFFFVLFLFPHFLPLFLFFVRARECPLQRRLCSLIMKTEQFLHLYLPLYVSSLTKIIWGWCILRRKCTYNLIRRPHISDPSLP